MAERVEATDMWDSFVIEFDMERLVCVRHFDRRGDQFECVGRIAVA